MAYGLRHFPGFLLPCGRTALAEPLPLLLTPPLPPLGKLLPGNLALFRGRFGYRGAI